MPRVVLMVVYETETEDQMREWLNTSLADGVPKGTKDRHVTAYTLNSDAYHHIAACVSELEDAYNRLVWTAPRVAPGPPTGDGRKNQ